MIRGRLKIQQYSESIKAIFLPKYFGQEKSLYITNKLKKETSETETHKLL